jgi:putative flavoprotein involved in K+ transport
VLNVTNVLWCTGFQPGFSWIDLPIHNGKEPLHQRGVVPSQPGLYFSGLHFLYALSSSMIHGADRDADYIASQIAARSNSPARAAAVSDQQAGSPSR